MGEKLRKFKREPKFDIRIGKSDTGAISVAASWGNYQEDYLRQRENNNLRPPADYLAGMTEITRERLPEILAACQALADTYSQPRIRGKVDPIEMERINLVESIVRDASGATPETFTQLPDDVKDVIKLCDGLEQIHHIITGSSYATPMDIVYPEQDASQCIEDFFSEVETSLRGILGEKGIDITFVRPDRVQFINALPNLLLETLDELVEQTGNELEQLDILETTIQRIVKPFTDKYIQRISSHRLQ